VAAGIAVVTTLAGAHKYHAALTVLDELRELRGFVPRYAVPPSRPGGSFVAYMRASGAELLSETSDRPRESRLFAPSLLNALDQAIRGYSAFSVALDMLQKQQSSKLIAEHLFSVVRSISAALEFVPHCQPLYESLWRANAYAYQMLAIALKSIDQIGVGVACMHESVAHARLVNQEEAFVQYLDKLERINRIEYAHQRVPDRESVHVSFHASTNAFGVIIEDGTYTVVGLELPVPA